MQLITYFCENCKKTSHVTEDESIPICCGKLMNRIIYENENLDASKKNQ